MEHGHLVQGLLTQAELACDEWGGNQVSRGWVFRSHGQTLESIDRVHQPIFSRRYSYK